MNNETNMCASLLTDNKYSIYSHLRRNIDFLLNMEAGYFNIDIRDKNYQRKKLEEALADGRIACDKERLQNIFSIKADNQSKVVESWQKSYPELNEYLEGWKYACVNESDSTHEEFKIFPVHRGKEMLCIFLGIFKTSTPDVIRVVHLRAKITFRVHARKLFDNVGYIERAIMFVLTDGLSEVLNYCYNSEGSNDIRLLDAGNNTEILAGIVLSEYYNGVRINWI